MNRERTLEASRKALSAADAITIAGSFSNVRPDRARHFARQAEEALYAALDSLSQAGLTDARPSFLPVAAEVTQSQLEQAA